MCLVLSSTNLAESQGIEPCDRFYAIYGLANRCITVLPTLHVKGSSKMEFNHRATTRMFQRALHASLFL